MYSSLRTFVHFFGVPAKRDQGWSWTATCADLAKDKFLG